MKQDHMEALLEQILHEVQAVHEVVAAQPTRSEFNELRQDVAELKQDAQTIKTAIKATNRDVADLDRRVVHPEAA